jgi:hypothetical protein
VGVARSPPPSKAPIAIPTISPITASMPDFIGAVSNSS